MGNPSGAIVSAAAAAGAGAAVGILLGRRKGLLRSGANEVRSLVGSNWRGWMTPGDVAIAAALAASGHKHLISNWAPAGVRDAQKRRLLQAASASLGQSVESLEPLRLDVLEAPLAERRPKELTTHGDVRTDEFYWLMDPDRKAPEVLKHLAAENTYTQAVLADTLPAQEQLYKEMRSRIKEDDQTVPYRLHGWYYYTRTLEGQQYRIHCRRAVPPGAAPPSEADAPDESVPEQVLLDENKRKEDGGHSFYMTGTVEPSPNHQLLAYSEDTVGGEKYTLRVKDLSTGLDVMEGIPDTSGDVEWAADNRTLFYVVKDPLDRPYKVLRHVIGQPTSSDVVVYEEGDASFYVGIHSSRSEKVIFISSGSAVTSEVRYIPSDQPTAEFKVILPRQTDVEYCVVHRGAHFFILLRDKDRPNSELRLAPVEDPTRQQVLLPHSRNVKLEDLSVAQRHLAVFERSGALQRVKVYALPADVNTLPHAPLNPTTAEEVAFDEPAYSLGGGGTGDFESPVLRLSYSSLTTPTSVIDYHMATGRRATKKVQPVLGGFDAARYKTLRLWAPSKDQDVQVPISLVYRKDAVKLDGTDPLLLNGYGSYEICNDPYFSANRLCLLDRGIIFAIAHIRGGGEMGRYWYEDGKYLKKKNTFEDFVAAAEHLIKERYTNPGRLCIEGRSAGGLLIGAVVNARPDLFHAAIMGVPFVDALTTMLDETIPLTIIEWEEWGNPAKPDFYEYMKSYSPVDNIQPGVEYPHILATGGLHDPRVGYWEPAKFVAKLRASRPPDSSRLLLLKMDMVGHFSVTGRFDKLKEVATEYAFLLKVLGMLKTPPAP